MIFRTAGVFLAYHFCKKLSLVATPLTYKLLKIYYIFVFVFSSVY